MKKHNIIVKQAAACNTNHSSLHCQTNRLYFPAIFSEKNNENQAVYILEYL